MFHYYLPKGATRTGSGLDALSAILFFDVEFLFFFSFNLFITVTFLYLLQFVWYHFLLLFLANIGHIEFIYSSHKITLMRNIWVTRKLSEFSLKFGILSHLKYCTYEFLIIYAINDGVSGCDTN